MKKKMVLYAMDVVETLVPMGYCIWRVCGEYSFAKYEIAYLRLAVFALSLIAVAHYRTGRIKAECVLKCLGYRIIVSVVVASLVAAALIDVLMALLIQWFTVHYFVYTLFEESPSD